MRILLLSALLLASCRLHRHDPVVPFGVEGAKPAEPLPEGVEAPVLEFRVDDKASLLSPETRAGLQVRLVDLAVETGILVSVVVVPKAEPATVEQLTLHAVARNRIDGMLVLLAVKEREVKVAAGPRAAAALEGKDLAAMIDEQVRPHLAEENFATALTHTMRLLESLLRPQ